MCQSSSRATAPSSQAPIAHYRGGRRSAQGVLLGRPQHRLRARARTAEAGVRVLRLPAGDVLGAEKIRLSPAAPLPHRTKASPQVAECRNLPNMLGSFLALPLTPRPGPWIHGGTPRKGPRGSGELLTSTQSRAWYEH